MTQTIAAVLTAAAAVALGADCGSRVPVTGARAIPDSKRNVVVAEVVGGRRAFTAAAAATTSTAEVARCT